MKDITTIFPYDLYGRAAAEFVRQVSERIRNPIYCKKNDREVNLHSLLGVLSLGIKEGETVSFYSHEEKDIQTLLKILSTK